MNGPIFNIPATVHVVMTHGPPAEILDEADPKAMNAKKASIKGCLQLHGSIAAARPMLHCSGHCHHSVGMIHAVWDGTAGGQSLIAASHGRQCTRSTSSASGGKSPTSPMDLPAGDRQLEQALRLRRQPTL